MTHLFLLATMAVAGTPPTEVPPPVPPVHTGYYVCHVHNARKIDFVGIAPREIDAQTIALKKCLARSMRCEPVGCDYLP